MIKDALFILSPAMEISIIHYLLPLSAFYAHVPRGNMKVYYDEGVIRTKRSCQRSKGPTGYLCFC